MSKSENAPTDEMDSDLSAEQMKARRDMRRSLLALHEDIGGKRAHILVEQVYTAITLSEHEAFRRGRDSHKAGSGEEVMAIADKMIVHAIKSALREGLTTSTDHSCNAENAPEVSGLSDKQRLAVVLYKLHSAVDAQLMGDTDLPDDDSPLMRAMQDAARLLSNIVQPDSRNPDYAICDQIDCGGYGGPRHPFCKREGCDGTGKEVKS